MHLAIPIIIGVGIVAMIAIGIYAHCSSTKLKLTSTNDLEQRPQPEASRVETDELLTYLYEASMPGYQA